MDITLITSYLRKVFATTADLTAHEAATDPHAGYQKETEKNAASGYAGLDASTNINTDQVATGSIENDAVTYAKLVNSAGFNVIGKATTGAGDPADIVAGDETVLGRTGAGNIAFAALATGQVANDAITNAKLANVNTATFKGRTTAASGDPEDLTTTQATALLDLFTSALKGLVPSSGGGTTNFLRADGSWVAAGAGSSQLEVTFYSDNVVLTETNQPIGERFFPAATTTLIHQVDLTNYTQVRLLVRQTVTSASANTPIMYAEYFTAFSVTLADYVPIGSSAVSISMAGTGLKASAWINLVAGAKADVFIAILESGGDSTADPAFASVVLQFK